MFFLHLCRDETSGNSRTRELSFYVTYCPSEANTENNRESVLPGSIRSSVKKVTYLEPPAKRLKVQELSNESTNDPTLITERTNPSYTFHYYRVYVEPSKPEEILQVFIPFMLNYLPFFHSIWAILCLHFFLHFPL